MLLIMKYDNFKKEHHTIHTENILNVNLWTFLAYICIDINRVIYLYITSNILQAEPKTRILRNVS